MTVFDYFHVNQPATDHALPVLVEVPHAGLAWPDAIAGGFEAKLNSIQTAADLYMDHACRSLTKSGATVVTALVSRMIVDFNRSADDLSLGILKSQSKLSPTCYGVLWTQDTKGNAVRSVPMLREEFRDCLDRFYFPYHRNLEVLLAQMKRKSRQVVFLAVHSMPSYSAPKMDVVLGSLKGKSGNTELLLRCADCCKLGRLRVGFDDPYQGGFSTRAYGKPEQGMHAIQIEFSRALYMDEDSLRPNEKRLEHIHLLLADLIATAADWVGSQIAEGASAMSESEERTSMR
ncbi:MAG: N-formylglutamate amidohydrolase [Myxococcales bacterium]|nr:MAG: N-formylglutamate amidohydrolase [Myxococcales bacterium]